MIVTFSLSKTSFRSLRGTCLEACLQKRILKSIQIVWPVAVMYFGRYGHHSSDYLESWFNYLESSPLCLRERHSYNPISPSFNSIRTTTALISRTIACKASCSAIRKSTYENCLIRVLVGVQLSNWDLNGQNPF